MYIHARKGGLATVQRRPRKQLRTYNVDIGRQHRKRKALFIASTVLLAVCLWQLGSYAFDYARSRQQAAELRALYASVTDQPTPVTKAPAITDALPMTSKPAETEAPSAATAEPTRSPLATMEPQAYPLNPYKIISDRFTKLRRQNSDIIGYLQLGDQLQEAVVQRDNTYYLRRDYKGYHNTNGAIFLDETCSLSTRPHTLILYGHNMKTGAMFGSLRNYENITYYHNSPFITFDTMYEEGRYVIFAVGVVSLNAQSRHYAGFYRLPTCTILERETIIQELRNISKHTCTVDVNVDDQLLLLVTCVDDESDRRIVAARRIRDDETEAKLLRDVKRSRGR